MATNKYLRPRRGKKSTAIEDLVGDKCLKKGEIFFEIPDEGIGKAAGKIKMGDGESDYEDLPYFLQPAGYDIIGDTDISGIADGTLTGAVSVINSNTDKKLTKKDLFPTKSFPTVILEITNDMIVTQYMTQYILSFTVDNMPDNCYIVLKFADNFNKTINEFSYLNAEAIKINNEYYIYKRYDQSYFSTFYMYNPLSTSGNNVNISSIRFISYTNNDSTYTRSIYDREAKEYIDVNVKKVISSLNPYWYDSSTPYMHGSATIPESFSWQVYMDANVNSVYVSTYNSGLKKIIKYGQYTIEGNSILNLYFEIEYLAYWHVKIPACSYLLFITAMPITTSGPFPSNTYSGVYYVTAGQTNSKLDPDDLSFKAPSRVTLAQSSTAPCTITGVAGTGTVIGGSSPDKFPYLKFQGSANKIIYMHIIRIL